MRKGFTLVEVMIVVAIIALLAAIAIPNLLRARQTAAESTSQAVLRTISTSCESYAAANDGTYPSAEGCLTNATPKYLNKSYCAAGVMNSYNYTCTMNTTGYSLASTPVGLGAGAKACIITTGGVLTCT